MFSYDTDLNEIPSLNGVKHTRGTNDAQRLPRVTGPPDMTEGATDASKTLLGWRQLKTRVTVV